MPGITRSVARATGSTNATAPSSTPMIATARETVPRTLRDSPSRPTPPATVDSPAVIPANAIAQPVHNTPGPAVSAPPVSPAATPAPSIGIPATRTETQPTDNVGRTSPANRGTPSASPSTPTNTPATSNDQRGDVSVGAPTTEVT